MILNDFDIFSKRETSRDNRSVSLLLWRMEHPLRALVLQAQVSGPLRSLFPPKRFCWLTGGECHRGIHASSCICIGGQMFLNVFDGVVLFKVRPEDH